MLVLKRPSLRLVIGVASGDQELNSPHRQTCSPAYSDGSSKVTLVVPPFLAGVFVIMRTPSSAVIDLPPTARDCSGNGQIDPAGSPSGERCRICRTACRKFDPFEDDNVPQYGCFP